MVKLYAHQEAFLEKVAKISDKIECRPIRSPRMNMGRSFDEPIFTETFGLSFFSTASYDTPSAVRSFFTRTFGLQYPYSVYASYARRPPLPSLPASFRVLKRPASREAMLRPFLEPSPAITGLPIANLAAAFRARQ